TRLRRTPWAGYAQRHRRLRRHKIDKTVQIRTRHRDISSTPPQGFGYPVAQRATSFDHARTYSFDRDVEAASAPSYSRLVSQCHFHA
ncbi:hypothetical protein M422DRAFT_32606, partial [Sphaerobolus stellatus SS14]